MTSTKKNPLSNDPNTMASYLNEISRIPLLSQEEEQELAVKAAAGDKVAKDKILSANLRFVVNVAKKYQNRGMELEDLVSEGNIGLMVAIERFDVTKGYRFISYAVWWIRQSILKALNEKSRMIRIPANRALEMTQINYAFKNISGVNKNEEQALSEVAKSLGMTESHVREMINISKDMISLDAEISSSDTGRSTVGDFIEDVNSSAPDKQAIDAVLRDDLDRLLENNLSERESEVIRARFGLDGNDGVSLKELGARFNLSKERVRQIEKKALYNLRECDDTYRLEGYVA